MSGNQPNHQGYDYNHATSGTQHAVLVILIIAVVVLLGGLFVGLNILDHL